MHFCKFLVCVIALVLVGCATPRSVSSIVTRTLTAVDGRMLIVEGQIPSTPIHGEIIQVKEQVKGTVPGGFGIPFSFTIEPGPLHLYKITGLWKYYAAELGKFTAYFPGLGVVVGENDTIGIRTSYDKSKMEWYVDNSAWNSRSGVETIWSRALSEEDRLKYTSINTQTQYAYRPSNDAAIRPSLIEEIRTGTGFAIAPDEIATAYHLVEGGRLIEVKFPGGNWIHAKIKTRSASVDVAIIEPKIPTGDWLTLSEKVDYLPGDQVFTLGFPVASILGDEVKYAEGVVSSLSGIGNEASVLQITVPIQPGNSGGPLVRLDGTVLGMVTSTVAVRKFAQYTGTLPQNVNWAVKADFIKALSKSDNSGVAMPKDRRDIISRTTKAVCHIRVTPLE